MYHSLGALAFQMDLGNCCRKLIIYVIYIGLLLQDGFLSEGSGEYKLILVVRNDLKMGKGKVAAQVSIQ